MNLAKISVTSAFAFSLLAFTGISAEKTQKQTCCQEAKAKGVECKHKCCVSAHKAGKSCEKCNPNKEDLKDPKKDPKPGSK